MRNKTLYIILNGISFDRPGDWKFLSDKKQKRFVKCRNPRPYQECDDKLMSSTSNSKSPSFQVRYQITCPHCWTVFPLENILWIAEAPGLVGDSRLGDSQQERFLPINFDLAGNAVDRLGFSCKKLACPYCHLQIPRPFIEMQSFFISIAGAPASGKSYFLTAMTWNLRRMLPDEFHYVFTDADPELNMRLLTYESYQFMNDDENATVKIEKTEEQGDSYNSVLINNQNITYLQPFLFGLFPTSEHPDFPKNLKNSLAISLYDNAGESYLPIHGGDSASLPVTRHLGKSHCIFFIFDPTQDNRFRAVCSNPNNDPQLNKETEGNFRKTNIRQEMVLAEVIKRTRHYMGMHIQEKYPHPLIVVVSKLDAWKDLLPDIYFRNPWAKRINTGKTVFLVDRVRDVSDRVRSLLKKHLPDMVSMVENFASNVIYIPISATGCPPTRDPETGEWGFQMKNLKPIWIEVPFLYALSQTSQDIIPCVF